MRFLLAIIALATLLPHTVRAADAIRLVPADQEARAKDPVYTGLDRSYRVRFPDLGGPVAVRETMVNPDAGWAEFAAKDAGTLYIVSVRIAPGAGGGELDAVRQRYADFPKQAPRNFVDGITRGPFGRTYTFTLLNADPVTGYPVKVALRPGNDIETAAVHRFFVANGYQYEVAFVAQRRGAFAKDDATALVARANAVLDRTLAGFQPLKPPAKK